MIGRLRHRITVVEEQKEDGALGPTVTETEVTTLWGAFAELSLEGRAKYQQIGHSTVAGKFIFRAPLSFDLEMSKHKFKYSGECYEAIEPPGNPDTLGRFVSVAVRKLVQQPVEDEDFEEPDEPDNGNGNEDEDDEAENIPGPL